MWQGIRNILIMNVLLLYSPVKILTFVIYCMQIKNNSSVLDNLYSNSKGMVSSGTAVLGKRRRNKKKKKNEGKNWNIEGRK